MSAPLALDAARTAVLSMDLQSFIVAQYANQPEAFLSRVAGVLARSRASGMTLIHVQVGFRPGLPEVSPRNMLFNSIRNNPKHQQAFLGPAGAIHPAVAPQEGDIVVTKHRVSAFSGTDLGMILRARNRNARPLRHRHQRRRPLYAPPRLRRRFSPHRPPRLLRRPGRGSPLLPHRKILPLPRLRRLLLRFPLRHPACVSPFVQVTPVLHLPFQPVVFSPSRP